MKTPEEIAREYAERLVTRKENQYGGRFILVGGVYAVGLKSGPSEVESFSTGDKYQRALTAAITASHLAAIEEYARQAPLPSPLSDEHETQIRRWAASDAEFVALNVVPAIKGLLAEVDFQRRIMADDVPSAASKIAHEKAAECERLREAMRQALAVPLPDGANLDHPLHQAQKILYEALREKPSGEKP